MADFTSIFRGKKITQMGLGLLGRGVGDAQWLAKAGAELLVTDQKSAEELAPSLELLRAYSNITYRLNEHFREDFRNRDLVLKGPGVPLDSPFIAEARQNGVPVDMSASLFARISGIPIVGVTGTRGKSTVTHLINAILTADGRRTLLGGNVKGVSNLSLLEEVSPEHIGVFELDSWQCQGFGEERSLDVPGVRQGPLSPQVAVFTTFMRDHMNYYRDSMETYLEDKAQIFLHQEESDTLVVGRQALPHLDPYKGRVRSHVVVADETTVPKSWKPRLIGEHNRYNIGVALATARVLGVDDEVTREVIEAFTALPGRLELVGEVKGVRVYNDTNATTPDATLASLRALDPEGEKRTVLIMGGADKQLNMDALAQELNDLTRAVIMLPGTGTDVFMRTYSDTLQRAVYVASLKEALDTALSYAKAGDAIVLSPAFASFGLFKNEYDRGDQFEALIQKL